MPWNTFFPMIAQVLITAIVLAIILLIAGVAIGGVVALFRSALGRPPVKRVKKDDTYNGFMGADDTPVRPPFKDGGYIPPVPPELRHRG